MKKEQEERKVERSDGEGGEDEVLTKEGLGEERRIVWGAGVYGRGEENKSGHGDKLEMLDPYNEWGEGGSEGRPGQAGRQPGHNNNNTLLARAAPLGLYLCKISEAALADGSFTAAVSYPLERGRSSSSSSSSSSSRSSEGGAARGQHGDTPAARSPGRHHQGLAPPPGPSLPKGGER
ncbi:hypothetical protein E2C01_053447 [Portunus trituberculatus]|uniref:Uncharacterized protein n=1 Tax=Portunus trituberculatus TaxID=210409 RepID=A0A5B7GQT9_PORTR|nr:hypothetical protein [Portunus trituberculatus]